jgi:hypothetical protein
MFLRLNRQYVNLDEVARLHFESADRATLTLGDGAIVNVSGSDVATLQDAVEKSCLNPTEPLPPAPEPAAEETAPSPEPEAPPAEAAAKK